MKIEYSHVDESTTNNIEYVRTEEHMSPPKGKEHCLALYIALFKLDPGEYLVITTEKGGRIVVQWVEGPDLNRFFEVTASGFRYRFKTIALDDDDTILCGTDGFRIVPIECEEWFRTWDSCDAMEGDT